MAASSQPSVGDTVSLLYDLGATPMTEAVRVTSRDGDAVVVERGAAAVDIALGEGVQLTVLYAGTGKLEGRSMTVARVRGNLRRLVSSGEESGTDRRRFVRAFVDLRVRLAPHGGGTGRWHEGTVDLSASGFCLAAEGPYALGDLFDVRLRPLASVAASAAEGIVVATKAAHARARAAGADETTARARDEVLAVARVVRTAASDGRAELAFEFVELGSVAENRLMRLVFDARMQQLSQRVADEG